MGYSAIWKILEEIIIEFRKRGLIVPEKVMTDLRSAKTMINLIDTSVKDMGEMAPKLEQYLTSVEGYLITEAQKSFPSKHIDEWLRRLEQATCDVCASVQTKKETRFISGVPRDQKWVRVKPIASLPLEQLKMLAEETGLSSRTDESDQFIAYGKPEDIKKFIGKMAKQTAKKRNSV